jgi:hypothetical protein
MRKLLVLCELIIIVMVLSFTHIGISFAKTDRVKPQEEVAQIADKKEEPEEEEEDDDC